MVEFIKTSKGYFYKIYKNGEKKRISESEYKKNNSKNRLIKYKMKGGMCGNNSGLLGRWIGPGETIIPINIGLRDSSNRYNIYISLYTFNSNESNMSIYNYHGANSGRGGTGGQYIGFINTDGLINYNNITRYSGNRPLFLFDRNNIYSQQVIEQNNFENDHTSFQYQQNIFQIICPRWNPSHMLNNRGYPIPIGQIRNYIETQTVPGESLIVARNHIFGLSTDSHNNHYTSLNTDINSFNNLQRINNVCTQINNLFQGQQIPQLTSISDLISCLNMAIQSPKHLVEILRILGGDPLVHIFFP